MKTIREWLEDLPEPYRGQALANAKDAGTIEESGYYSLSVALISAFDWEDSSAGDGYAYWEVIAKSEGKVLPYAGQTEAPTNALSALHAIALKEGFPVEEITAVQPLMNDNWRYALAGIDKEFIINLKIDK